MLFADFLSITSWIDYIVWLTSENPDYHLVAKAGNSSRLIDIEVRDDAGMFIMQRSFNTSLDTSEIFDKITYQNSTPVYNSTKRIEEKTKYPYTLSAVSMSDYEYSYDEADFEKTMWDFYTGSVSPDPSEETSYPESPMDTFHDDFACGTECTRNEQCGGSCSRCIQWVDPKTGRMSKRTCHD